MLSIPFWDYLFDSELLSRINVVCPNELWSQFPCGIISLFLGLGFAVVFCFFCHYMCIAGLVIFSMSIYIVIPIFYLFFFIFICLI